MDDTEAMNAIHALMDGTEWSADTLEEIADVVLATGRTITDPNEVTLDRFSAVTGLGPDVAPIAFADWIDSYKPFVQWWTDNQGRYL
jgi:hypothetical protein